MTTDTVAALKPCPFCGGEAEIVRYGTPRQSTQYRCTNCGCQLETGETFNYGANWNKRWEPPKPGNGWQPPGKCTAVVGTWGQNQLTIAGNCLRVARALNYDRRWMQDFINNVIAASTYEQAMALVQEHFTLTGED
jgi:hypothetical protein